MSGRSAYVRKEKTKTKEKDTSAPVMDGTSDKPFFDKAPAVGDFSMPNGRQLSQHMTDMPFRSQNNEIATIKTNVSGGSDDLAYARVRKPQVPALDVSGIEKSSFRTAMDKKSEETRKGLVKLFGRKKNKKAEEGEHGGNSHRPAAAAASRPETYELDTGEYIPPPISRPRTQTHGELGLRTPPAGKLPAEPSMYRWMGNRRPPQVWNKMRKDPELWDPNGDTLVFYGHETNHAKRDPPSFRLQSHVLEQTESRFLVTLLREGSIDESDTFSMPPSPISSPGVRPAHLAQAGRSRHPTPPMSEGSITGVFDGQISYEVYFPVPRDESKQDTMRHQITTRNVFALLYQASLVGYNLYQALNDLHQRLGVYMPEHHDPAGMIIDYVVSRGLDDVREDPAAAAALLAWSEAVRWDEGWREAYVHCTGMYHRLEGVPDFRYITPITRALLERASLEMQVRVHNCEIRFVDFDFEDMWPIMSSHPPPARTAFERLRKFLQHHYHSTYGAWPPAQPDGHEQWLTRALTQKLQKDFGSLYDYLVDRDVAWDCSEERSGRKWNIIHPTNRAFDADTQDLPFTDILIAFDNRHKFPHIPHPYPLVPESVPTRTESKGDLFKASKRPNKPVEDKMAERKAALAYTESTNIYLLGSDFVNNDLVDAYVRFEKSDRAGDVDPYAARRGRWVLIYGILQTLASVSVDTPNLRYTTDVSYHMNPRLRGTPPWKGANQNVQEASHSGSHCWTVRDTWVPEAPVMLSRRGMGQLSVRSRAPSITSSDAGSSIRTPTLSSTSLSMSISAKSSGRRRREPEGTSYSGYAPGIEKLVEWPIHEESMDYGERMGYLQRDAPRKKDSCPASAEQMEYSSRGSKKELLTVPSSGGPITALRASPQPDRARRQRKEPFPLPPAEGEEYRPPTKEERIPSPLKDYTIKDFDEYGFGGHI
ncbi:hypothetical protein QTJ16_006893 [Diplocarpon rosae]|uniref:DUF8004 domain-containing protein n=1 Tax=Diplocarpon rosae TaxID=946125 RepID=A0AAD9SUI4_9HELO|nr:hypothetical protein QTJ16_006893 [Diplocarpon rosae]